eukprot:Tbor_TRINITY_DN5825_c1_g1::TRINITY_DN5825_c1_g1_i1::g.6674::m.6674/K03263/EIF5A; translation initiation factor 5A
MSDDETFQTAVGGGSLTFPIQAGALKKGDHMVIKGHPCKIIDMSVSKTGKHGHAKASIVAVDIFTKQKLEDQAPTTHNVEAPFVKSQAFSLMDINEEGGLSLMDEENNMREDLNLPPDEELASEIKRMFEDGKDLTLNVVSAMGTEQVLSLKVDSKQ